MKVRVHLEPGEPFGGPAILECNQCGTLNRYADALCLGCEQQHQIVLLGAHNEHVQNALHKIITVAEIQDRTIGTLLASVAALTIQVGQLVAGADSD